MKSEGKENQQGTQAAEHRFSRSDMVSGDYRTAGLAGDSSAIRGIAQVRFAVIPCAVSVSS
jgi:hypothetical protein